MRPCYSLQYSYLGSNTDKKQAIDNYNKYMFGMFWISFVDSYIGNKSMPFVRTIHKKKSPSKPINTPTDIFKRKPHPVENVIYDDVHDSINEDDPSPSHVWQDGAGIFDKIKSIASNVFNSKPVPPSLPRKSNEYNEELYALINKLTDTYLPGHPKVNINEYDLIDYKARASQFFNTNSGAFKELVSEVDKYSINSAYADQFLINITTESVIKKILKLVSRCVLKDTVCGMLLYSMLLFPGNLTSVSDKSGISIVADPTYMQFMDQSSVKSAIVDLYNSISDERIDKYKVYEITHTGNKVVRYVVNVNMQVPDSKVAIIGDITGSIWSLPLTILQYMDVTGNGNLVKPYMHLVFTGDVLNKVPLSVEMLSILLLLKHSNPHTVHLIYGNRRDVIKQVDNKHVYNYVGSPFNIEFIRQTKYDMHSLNMIMSILLAMPMYLLVKLRLSNGYKQTVYVSRSGMPVTEIQHQEYMPLSKKLTDTYLSELDPEIRIQFLNNIYTSHDINAHELQPPIDTDAPDNVVYKIPPYLINNFMELWNVNILVASTRPVNNTKHLMPRYVDPNDAVETLSSHTSQDTVSIASSEESIEEDPYTGDAYITSKLQDPAYVFESGPMSINTSFNIPIDATKNAGILTTSAYYYSKSKYISHVVITPQCDDLY